MILKLPASDIVPSRDCDTFLSDPTLSGERIRVLKNGIT